MGRVSAAVLLWGLATLARATQSSSIQYDAGLFTPFGDLSALSASQYTVLTHPGFASHSVRIKQSHFCDESVRAYTGYIDVDARHLFFYFFESRRDPDTDPVVLWTNGGPGGSSTMGLFMELGPCRMAGPNATVPFEYSWNEQANIFSIDQPVDVGFSYADYGEHVDTSEEGGKDIAAFMAIFFEHFSQFRGRPFHMTGESYAGRYLPVYAAAVYDQNTELVKAGMSPINLSSVMMGNGATDFFEIVWALYDMRCKTHKFPMVDTISDCAALKQLVTRCKKWTKSSCNDVYDKLACSSAFDYCFDNIGIQFFQKYNPYDATRPWQTFEADVCYPDVAQFLSSAKTQALLGVDSHKTNFSTHSALVSDAFEQSGDYHSFRADHYLAALLERHVRVLIYVGTNDWIASWVGNERMTFKLEWTQQDVYQTAGKHDWFVAGMQGPAGWWRKGGGLTFATVYGAGHLVPFDQPERALHMANRWLAGEDL
ncbi:serine carboxypeptidase [Epithele typhae]|uniref:serine carboxypeptidase n=1 Tax=Epithele typhae TaxID=378194 RepID=UPI0020079CDD|nr:serine carboxypeptidase [Epithele typhae]KAH9924334.1 serine carboxypeptidase [Epithele typhae]